MNYRSYVNLGQSVTGNDNPNYARIKKLSDGSYILFNHYGGQGNANGFDIYYATSPDLENWTGRGLFLERYVITNSRGNQDKRVFTNPNAIVLSNGDLLAFASYRANMSYNYLDCQYDHGIVILRSTDNGRTWSDPQEIYHGSNWEAHMVEMPSGELQCYFSESRPWISGGHSGTSMIVSADHGATWTPELDQTPWRVIRQHWENSDKNATFYTDQMPVVVRLNNSNKLAAALESAVSCVNGSTSYAISFAYSDDKGQWGHLKGDETGPADRQSNLFDGAAPFLVQFPSGETLVSYGLSSRMNMRLGDAEARTFGEPFAALPGRGSWGCLEMNGSHEVIAAMRNSEKPGDITIALARFELNHRITATRRTISVDGGNAEWAGDRRRAVRRRKVAGPGHASLFVRRPERLLSRGSARRGHFARRLCKYLALTRQRGRQAHLRRPPHQSLAQRTEEHGHLCRRLARDRHGASRCRPPTTARSRTTATRTTAIWSKSPCRVRSSTSHRGRFS